MNITIVLPMKTNLTCETGFTFFNFAANGKLLSLSTLPLLLPPVLAALLFLLLDAVDAMVRCFLSERTAYTTQVSAVSDCLHNNVT